MLSINLKCLLTSFGMLLILAACNSSNPPKTQNFIESKPSFFELRHGRWIRNLWVRKPENLQMIHQTFKKFGYLKLLKDDILNSDFMLLDNHRKGKDLLDSLIISYDKPNFEQKYYREFWQRRKAEKNDTTVYLILYDIKLEINGVKIIKQNYTSANDTLFKLLTIEFKDKPLNLNEATKDFSVLRQLGFHQSAYNLLFEKYSYQDLKWNRDSLVKSLKTSTQFTYPWFEDDTK
jgi:hypothetical protein